MRNTLLGIVAGFSDEDLLRRVRLLAGREREATVELVAHLSELAWIPTASNRLNRTGH